MAVTNGRIEGHTAGDDWQILQRIPSIPSGQTVATARLVVATVRGVPAGDSRILIDRTITPTPGGNGQIMDTGLSGQAALNFLLPRSITRLLTPGTAYETDIVCVLSGTAQATPWSGQLIADGPVIAP